MTALALAYCIALGPRRCTHTCHNMSSGLGAGCTLNASRLLVDCGNILLRAARVAAAGVLNSTMKEPMSGPDRTCEQIKQSAGHYTQ